MRLHATQLVVGTTPLFLGKPLCVLGLRLATCLGREVPLPETWEASGGHGRLERLHPTASADRPGTWQAHTFHISSRQLLNIKHMSIDAVCIYIYSCPRAHQSPGGFRHSRVCNMWCACVLRVRHTTGIAKTWMFASGNHACWAGWMSGGGLKSVEVRGKHGRRSLHSDVRVKMTDTQDKISWANACRGWATPMKKRWARRCGASVWWWRAWNHQATGALYWYVICHLNLSSQIDLSPCKPISRRFQREKAFESEPPSRLSGQALDLSWKRSQATHAQASVPKPFNAFWTCLLRACGHRTPHNSTYNHDQSLLIQWYVAYMYMT